MVHSMRPAGSLRWRPVAASVQVTVFLLLKIMPGRAAPPPMATPALTAASAACMPATPHMLQEEKANVAEAWQRPKSSRQRRVSPFQWLFPLLPACRQCHKCSKRKKIKLQVLAEARVIQAGEGLSISTAFSLQHLLSTRAVQDFVSAKSNPQPRPCWSFTTAAWTLATEQGWCSR